MFSSRMYMLAPLLTSVWYSFGPLRPPYTPRLLNWVVSSIKKQRAIKGFYAWRFFKCLCHVGRCAVPISRDCSAFHQSSCCICHVAPEFPSSSGAFHSDWQAAMVTGGRGTGRKMHSFEMDSLQSKSLNGAFRILHEDTLAWMTRHPSNKIKQKDLVSKRYRCFMIILKVK